jgi:hypothetical protein
MYCLLDDVLKCKQSFKTYILPCHILQLVGFFKRLITVITYIYPVKSILPQNPWDLKLHSLFGQIHV